MIWTEAEFQFFLSMARARYMKTPEAYISLRKRNRKKNIKKKDIFELYKRWKDALEQDGFTTVEQVSKSAVNFS